MKVPASGEAAKTPGGWAFSSLISQETLLPSCPTRACPLQLQSPQGPPKSWTTTAAAPDLSSLWTQPKPAAHTLRPPWSLGSPGQDMTATQALQLGTGGCGKHPEQV